eukprot:684112-Amphidinium_carterae.1
MEEAFRRFCSAGTKHSCALAHPSFFAGSARFNQAEPAEVRQPFATNGHLQRDPRSDRPKGRGIGHPDPTHGCAPKISC